MHERILSSRKRSALLDGLVSFAYLSKLHDAHPALKPSAATRRRPECRGVRDDAFFPALFRSKLSEFQNLECTNRLIPSSCERFSVLLKT